MPLPAGRRHDLIFHLNNSVTMGGSLKPLTFRVAIAPRFIPRFAVGDPRGTDKSRWKSWVQARFDGGAGQIFLSSPVGNNRYAESNLMDIGLPITALGGLAGRADPVTQAAADPELDDDPVGDLSVALIPRGTSLEAGYGGGLFTNEQPVHIFEYSFRPHMFHWVTRAVYTNITGVDVFGGQRGPLETADALTGEWAVQDTQMPGTIVSATRYSGVLALALESGGVGNVHIYGADNSHAASTLYAPAYTTLANRIGTYDSKLWRAEVGRVAYLDPTIVTGQWSAYISTGDPSIPINNMTTAFGRYYLGKEDSLWIFDAGRTYEVENYTDQRDSSNFSLMVLHRGALYYNIRNKIYRITSGNLIELLATPNIDGVVTDGAATGSELHITYKEPSGDSRMLIFDPETGGTRQWFGTDEISYKDANLERGISSVRPAFGYLWMAPTHISAAWSSVQSFPVMAVNRINPDKASAVPFFAKTHAYAILSMTDFGQPNVSKELRRVVTDRTIHNSGEQIAVYYANDIFDSAITQVFIHEPDDPVFTDGTTAVTNGSVLDSDGNLDVTPDSESFLYIALSRPPKALKFKFGPDNPSTGVQGSWDYWNGSDWVQIGAYNGIEYVPPTRVVDGTIQSSQDGILYLPEINNWAILVDPAISGGTAIEGYYVRSHSAPSGGRRWDITEITAVTDLTAQAWTLLGTMTDTELTREALNFPHPYVTDNIMLMYRPIGTDVSRPSIRRVEIEYLEIEFPHRTLYGTIMAVDRLETEEMGVVENSASFIQQSLYSMAMSGLTHVIEPPPIPIFADDLTIRGQVSIIDPGGAWPILGYDSSTPDAEISIRIDEL